MNNPVARLESVFLPPAIAEEYLAAPVQFLSAKSSPDYTGDKTTPDQLNQQQQLHAQVARVACSAAAGFLITDKNSPHAVREVMWIDGRELPASGTTEAPELMSDILQEARVFIDFCSGQDLYPTFSWSHDPLTRHRVSIQGEKRLHMHGIARNETEIELARTSRATIGELSFVDRRRIADEVAVIGKLIGTEIAVAQDIATADIHPALLSVRLPSLDSLDDPRYATTLLTLLNTFQLQYDSIISQLGGESPKGMINTTDLALDKTPYFTNPLSSLAEELIKHFVRGLRQVDDATLLRFTRPPLKHYGKTFIPLSGLAYSATLASVADEYYVHFRFSKFSDMGGAGCTIIDGVPTRVQRGLGVMTTDDMHTRRQFQQSFKERLAERDVLAGNS